VVVFAVVRAVVVEAVVPRGGGKSMGKVSFGNFGVLGVDLDAAADLAQAVISRKMG
jgi:hypothetical protein